MAFTVRDFQDLVRLLREHPEWREELRALLLSAELLSLPELVRGLGEKLDRLSAAQLKAEERLARLEELVAELAQAQARTEERLAELAHAQARTEAALERLTATMTTLVEAQRRTEADVGELKGISLELRWRERAPAYLAKLLRRARLIPDSELMELLDSEKVRSLLSEEEREDLLLADFVVWGRRKADEGEVYLVGEVSWVVDCADVERARRRADLFSRLGITAFPVVAGRTITEEADHLARERKVLRFLDGIYHPD
ncbi:MAG: hypothetical protein ACP5LK_06455 [Candidatus Bipolaricaulaceae bacterium]